MGNRVEKIYHVYIMAGPSRVRYVGVTSNLFGRVWQHKEERVAGFTSRYSLNELMYCEPFGDVRRAIAREKQIKAWRRSKRVALINSLNPKWEDLSAGWYSKGSRSVVAPSPKAGPRMH